jgi:HEAT repeats
MKHTEDPSEDERRRARIAADWRFPVIPQLLQMASAEPDLRYPSLCAAFGMGRSLDQFPADTLQWLSDYLRPAGPITGHRAAGFSDERTQLNSALVVGIMRAPRLFSDEACANLMLRIKSDRELFLCALNHPDFARFPGAKEHCADGIGHSSAAVANKALAIFIEHWPAELEHHADLLMQHMDSNSRTLRRNIAIALGHIGRRAPSSVPIRRLMLDPERIVRKAALSSLVQLVGAEAAPDLVVALRDPAPLVRIEACRLVAALGDTALLSALQERAADSSTVVRRAALAAIEVLDRDLALRSFPAFAKGEAGLPLELQEEFLPAEETKKESEEDDVDAAIDNLEWSDSLDFATTDLLRCLVLAQFIADSVRHGNSLEDAFERGPFEKSGTSPENTLNRFLEEADDPASLEELITYLVGISPMDPAAEAFLIGFTGEEQMARAFSAAHVRKLRSLPDGAGAFWKIVSVYGPSPRSLYWPVSRRTLGDFPDEHDEENSWDADDISLALKILPSLRTWALIRATPRYLGFVLACATPDWWRRLPFRGEVSPSTLKLVQEYRGFATSLEVVAEIERRWQAGAIAEDSAELELVAGMGDRGVRLMVDHGQRALFTSTIR